MASRSGSEYLTDEELAYEVIRRVRPFYRVLVSAVDRNLEGTDVSVALRGMLEVLAESGPLTVPDLARAHSVGRQFVQRMIDQAERDGLVERKVNPAHRRSVLFALTREGRDTFDMIRKRELKAIRKAASGISRSDLTATLKVIQHMTGAFAEQ